MSTGLVFQQIPKVMKDIVAVAKTRENKAQGFAFRGVDEIYNELHDHLANHKLFTVTEVLEEKREERQTKSGGVMVYTILKVKFTLYAEDGSSVSSVMIGEASDTGDKSSNKAMSVAHKYFFLQTFVVPTKDDKDPDASSAEFTPKTTRPSAKQPYNPAEFFNAEEPMPSNRSPGDFVIDWGKKYNGISLRDMKSNEISEYLNYLRSEAKKKGKTLDGKFALFEEAAVLYLDQLKSEDRKR